MTNSISHNFSKYLSSIAKTYKCFPYLLWDYHPHGEYAELEVAQSRLAKSPGHSGWQRVPQGLPDHQVTQEGESEHCHRDAKVATDYSLPGSLAVPVGENTLHISCNQSNISEYSTGKYYVK